MIWKHLTVQSSINWIIKENIILTLGWSLDLSLSPTQSEEVWKRFSDCISQLYLIPLLLLQVSRSAVSREVWQWDNSLPGCGLYKVNGCNKLGRVLKTAWTGANTTLLRIKISLLLRGFIHGSRSTPREGNFILSPFSEVLRTRPKMHSNKYCWPFKAE